jgi:penicillin-binding protein 2
VNRLIVRPDAGDLRRRSQWMVVVVLVAFGVLFGRLVQLQVVQSERHRGQALRNITGKVRISSTRGIIRDANGQVLAANRPSFDVYVVPGVIDLDETWARTVELMGLGDDEAEPLRAKIERIRNEDGNRKHQQILLKVDVSRDVVAALETHAADLPGIDVTPTAVRHYPHGKTAAHVLGYMREVDAETLARLRDRGYRSGDRLGAIGVERRWEGYLRGQRGSRKVLRATRSRMHRMLAGDAVLRDELEGRYLEEPRRVAPIPGRDLTLTLDIELQKAIPRALRGQRAGAVVVVDVNDGSILATYSGPGFDPNVVSGASGKQAIRDAFKRLYADPLKPTLDKTTSAAYPPGSTYKPFTVLAALADGLITPKTRVDCRGAYHYGNRAHKCEGVHRKVNLHEAIIQSCNVYIYSIGEHIAIDSLAKMGTAFGFGDKTGLGLNPETKGLMPTRAWYTQRNQGRFHGGNTLNSAIGQGATTVSVMQLALSYAALANGGTLYQPQVVRSIETTDGTIVQEFPPRVRREVDINPVHLEMVQNALTGVVAHPDGTAFKERIRGVDLAGKTGTAEVSKSVPEGTPASDVWYYRRAHAWFAGYAPAKDPEIAVVVLIEHGGGGGKNAVPVAMRVVKAWQELKAKRDGNRSASSSPATVQVKGKAL